MTRQNIIGAMERAAVAYHDTQPVVSDAKQIAKTSPDDIQYYLTIKDSGLKITFRGSNSRRDWKTNLTFWKKTIPYGNSSSKIRVHSGFINAYKSPEVRDYIRKYITKDILRVQVAGHSLGAALAVLCAVDIQYNYPEKDVECYLFGCPRVGNRAFKDSFNKRVFKTIRVENGNDIVTKVPFALWGYRHVGAKIHIGSPRIFGLFSAKAHYQHAYYSSLILKFLT